MNRARIFRYAAVILPCAAWLLTAAPASAQSLRLTLSTSTITFASADPDTTPSIASPAVTVSYRVRNNNSGNWQITLLAGGDLTSAAGTIDITNVTWTAAPVPPFQSGTLSHTLAQRLAAGVGNVQSTQTGTVVFSLANSWTYNVGVYTATVTFTLIAP
jgi:hypothetical protein